MPTSSVSLSFDYSYFESSVTAYRSTRSQIPGGLRLQLFLSWDRSSSLRGQINFGRKLSRNTENIF